jgi:CO dehydrogenase maturation factor
MRIALVGKGGSGKSTIAGTFARLLARDGERVLALDVDTMPGLAYSIGLGRIADAGLPEELGERRPGEGWVLREPISAEDLVDRYALTAPDGVRFLQLGKLPGHVRPGSIIAFRHVVETFRRPGWSIVGDLAAGTRQGLSGWAGFASLIGIVVEPTRAALLSARRLGRLAQLMPEARVGVIINKARGDDWSHTVRAELPFETWAVVPHDEGVAAAEREGLAPIDVASASDAITAITRLVSDLRSLSGETRAA